LRSAISENKLFEKLWRCACGGAGVPANLWPPCSAAEGTKGGLKVPGIVQSAGRVGAVVLVNVMRFLNLRLKPKAAVAPKRGRGPGTDDDGDWTAANATGPMVPVKGTPAAGLPDIAPHPTNPGKTQESQKDKDDNGAAPRHLASFITPEETVNPPYVGVSTHT